MRSRSCSRGSAASWWSASVSTASGRERSRRWEQTSGSRVSGSVSSRRAPSGSSARSRRGSSSTCGPDAPAASDDVDRLHLADRRETAERLELDLADPLTREPEPAPDLLQRLWLGTAEPVAHDNDLALALRERC